MNKEWAIRDKKTGNLFDWPTLFLDHEHVKETIARSPNPDRYEAVYREVGEWTSVEEGSCQSCPHPLNRHYHMEGCSFKGCPCSAFPVKP